MYQFSQATGPSTAPTTSPPKWHKNTHLLAFFCLFSFRYIRAIANLLILHTGIYCPMTLPKHQPPPFTPSDITVIIPTTNLSDPVFHRALHTITAHSVSKIIITTAGTPAKLYLPIFKSNMLAHDPRILVLHSGASHPPNRRQQTAAAMPYVSTPLLILCDDHTAWPRSKLFLPTLIAPFADANIGAVGPGLSARHNHHALPSWKGFWNFIGMAYLQRRTHEACAVNAVDGGVSCLSSRIAVFRREVYASREFLEGYLNEFVGVWVPWVRWRGGGGGGGGGGGSRVEKKTVKRWGPLNVDDDKFHTRWLLERGWGIKMQVVEREESGFGDGKEEERVDVPDTMVVAELGAWPRYKEQVLRWNRTTYRSNIPALFALRNYVRYPYTTYEVFFWSMARMTLFYEAAMFYFLFRALETLGLREWFGTAASLLAVWILGMRFAKIASHFKKYPKDMVYFPGYVLFAWWCSFVKVWALLTFWNIEWGTATRAAMEIEVISKDEKEGNGDVKMENIGDGKEEKKDK